VQLCAGTDDASSAVVDPIYSLLKSAAGLPSARTPASSCRGSSAPPASAVAGAAVIDVQASTTSDAISSKNKNDDSSAPPSSAQFQRSDSSSPHKPLSPHQRLQPLQQSLQQQQQQRKPTPSLLHLPGMPAANHFTSGDAVRGKFILRER